MYREQYRQVVADDMQGGTRAQQTVRTWRTHCTVHTCSYTSHHTRTHTHTHTYCVGYNIRGVMLNFNIVKVCFSLIMVCAVATSCCISDELCQWEGGISISTAPKFVDRPL